MAPTKLPVEVILFERDRKIGNTVAVANKSATKNIRNTLRASSAKYQANIMATGTVAIAA